MGPLQRLCYGALDFAKTPVQLLISVHLLTFYQQATCFDHEGGEGGEGRGRWWGLGFFCWLNAASPENKLNLLNPWLLLGWIFRL